MPLPIASCRVRPVDARTYRVGEFEIAIVSDGYIKLDAGAVNGLVPRLLWEPVIGPENVDAQHRMALGRARHIERPTHREMLALVREDVKLCRIEEAAAFLVTQEGIVFPAVPETQHTQAKQ